MKVKNNIFDETKPWRTTARRRVNCLNSYAVFCSTFKLHASLNGWSCMQSEEQFFGCVLYAEGYSSKVNFQKGCPLKSVSSLTLIRNRSWTANRRLGPSRMRSASLQWRPPQQRPRLGFRTSCQTMSRAPSWLSWRRRSPEIYRSRHHRIFDYSDTKIMYLFSSLL